jgi:V8-like Glu-specific endopeptidase
MALTQLDPAHFPNICPLRLTFRKAVAGGTGFLIKPQVLLTAAHNLFDPSANRGGQVQTIEVSFPGANIEPIAAMGFRYPPQWETTDSFLSTRGLSAVDYGVVFLPEPVTTVPALQYGVSTDQAAQAPIAVAGFPIEKGVVVGLFGADADAEVPSANPGLVATRIFYTVPTIGGMSGGPVWRLANNVPAVHGIHTSLGDISNLASALRITQTVEAWIRQW